MNLGSPDRIRQEPWIKPARRRNEDMDIDSKPLRNDIADELDSLREEIAHLQTLIQLQSSELASSERPVGFDTSAEIQITASLIEDGPFGMAILDSQYRIVQPNKALRRLLGYTEAELRSLSIADIVRDAGCIQIIKQVLEGVLPSTRFEEQFLSKSREALWVQVTVSANTKIPAKSCVILVEDIGVRKWAELALQNDKQLLEGLINSSVDGILAFDREGFFTIWNPGMERIFGVSAKETLGRPALKACPFLQELGEDANIVAALKGNKVISRDKQYVIPGTNRPVYFEGYYGPMHDTHTGEVIGGLAIIRDVTERRLAEEGKRISEDRYRELFENAYDMVYTFDLAGKITSINKAAERIVGYSRTEALQMRFSQFVAPEFQQIVRRMIDRQIADEAPTTQELDIVTKDKRRVTLEVSHRLIFHEGKPIGIQGIARDITERKKTEEALQQANKTLEAWVHELEQRTREMTLLSEMGDILRACLTIEEVYEVIVRVAQEIFPQQGGALFVIGPLRNIVEAVAEWGDISGLESTFTPDECWALRRGRVHWVEDTKVGLICKHIQNPPPNGYLCVPMMAQSEAVGVLHLVQPEGTQMPEAKQRLAMAMAEHVGMALSNLRLHETLRNQSIRDQLTGLFNRSFMEESLELELRRAARSQLSLSLIMLELDNFQLITEDFGLDVGDSILRRTGMLLQANVRKGDIACRYNNQTYVVILPQGGFEAGRLRAETLCSMARTLEVKYQSAQVGHITASLGLAIFPGHGQTVESLLRSAEAALNRAKNNGGDCVVVAN
jgi:diguanylate cyclase (GGDEF)-like protein/PAS domain S-box-containing protein